MTKTKDSCDWTFGLEYAPEFEPLYEPEQIQAIEHDCDVFYEVTQLTFDDLPA